MLIPMGDLQSRYGVHPKGVLHVGGHIGEEADAYDAAGIRQVVWVEPHPDAYPSLLQRIHGRPSHQAFQVAASDRDDCTVPLYKASNICSSSLLPMHKHREKHPDVTPCGTVTVLSMTLDTLFSRKGLNPADYDFLNMDIQGGELLALKGMNRILKDVRWVYTEVNTEELYKGCVLLPELTRHLEERGFKLVERRMWSETHGWGDAFYVR